MAGDIGKSKGKPKPLPSFSIRAEIVYDTE